MNANWIGMHSTKIANAAATINAGIAIQALAIASGDGYADAVVVADDWSHITDCDQPFRAVVAAAEEGYHPPVRCRYSLSSQSLQDCNLTDKAPGCAGKND